MKEWYIYLYIEDTDRMGHDIYPEVRTIKIEKDKTYEDLLLKIYERDIDNEDFFVNIFGTLDDDIKDNLLQAIFVEYCKLDLGSTVNMIEKELLINWGFKKNEMYGWLHMRDDDDKTREKKFQISKKICNKNLSDSQKIDAMQNLIFQNNISIERAEEWQKEKEKYKKKISDLKEKLEYTPGNIGYFRAMEDFNDKKIGKKIEN